MTPSNEQLEIIKYNEGNVVITAAPGSGKTFTIVECISKIVPTLKDYQGIIAISYTNKASDELYYRAKKKCPNLALSFFGTIDKFYISEIIIPFASHFLGRKIELQIDDIDSKKNEALENKSQPLNDNEVSLITSYLQNGIIPLSLTGVIALYFLRNIPQVILFLKARYTHIFIDEYQDCGVIQHEIFLLLVSNNIIGYAVGDPNQAIFEFSKKYPKYLISLIDRPDFKHFLLSTNFRCHPSITNYSHVLYGNKSTIDKSIEKRVFGITILGAEQSIADYIDQKVEPIKTCFKLNNENQISIIVRCKSTLEAMNKYLSIPHKTFDETPLDKDCSYSGRFYKELLMSLFSFEKYDYFALAEKWFPEEINIKSHTQGLQLLKELFAVPEEKLVCKIGAFKELCVLYYPEMKEEVLQKSTETLEKILKDKEQLNTFKPANAGEVNLMTIHKAKGLEFKVVFCLDLYSYFDERDKENINLHYVAITRAIDACILITSTSRYVKKYGCVQSSTPSPFFSNQKLVPLRKNDYWPHH